MAEIISPWYSFPDKETRTNFMRIYNEFLAGGIQYQVDAPEAFWEIRKLSELEESVPQELRRTHRKDQWITALLLADGDITLSLSSEFINSSNAQDINQTVQTLLKKIQDDVTFFQAGIRRFLNWVTFAFFSLTTALSLPMHQYWLEKTETALAFLVLNTIIIFSVRSFLATVLIKVINNPHQFLNFFRTWLPRSH